MIIYSYRIITRQPARSALTIGGIALCVILMLFLLSIYRGVSEGSVDYIRETKADLWVLQEYATNILRGSSILSTGHGVLLREIPSVQTVSPILFLLSSVKNDGTTATVYLTGYDLSTGIGGPPKIAAGRVLQRDDEIVLDRSFAAKMGFHVGDYVRLKEDSLKIVGLSAGTNMFVIQYAFVTLRAAQSQVGYPGLVSCFAVQAKDPGDLRRVQDDIRRELPGIEAYSRSEFLQNNILEMESGFLPLLYVIAAIGSIVLTTILSLLLSINILEGRKDFAVMKTLGSPQGFLPRLILQQSVLISLGGILAAVGMFYPLLAVVEQIAPEVGAQSSLSQIAAVIVTVLTISLLSSFIAIRRILRIYPLEAFA